MASIETITLIRNTDEKFYPLMGRFLSQRSIVKELGYNVWDDANKTWLIAVLFDDVRGFCAYKRWRRGVEFCSDYVLPEHRGYGVYDKLFAHRLALNNYDFCFAKATSKSINTFLRHGFKKKHQIGRYTLVERIANNE